MGEKVIKDLVYGYIKIDDDVQKIVDSAIFQRLRRIKQLTCALIFPSVNHTRYEHSLGVMKLACDFFHVIEKDLVRFGKNEKEIEILRLNLKYAALLHDLGHPPYSHLGEKFYNKNEIYYNLKSEYGSFINVEKTFKNKEGKIVGKEHELMSCYCLIKKFKKVLYEINKNLYLELICRVIIGNSYEDIEKYWAENILIEIINSKTIDVDKIDYLMRDNLMTGDIAPKIDVERLLTSISVGEDRKLKYVAKAIPAIQNVVDSRDLLYMWVYHHHISIYTEYIMGELLKHFIKLHKNENGKYLEEMDRDEYFSCSAIADKMVTDDDIYSHFRKAYINSLNGKSTSYTALLTKQIFERNFLKTSWKTLYEYKTFEDELVKNGYISSSEALRDFIKDEKKVKEIVRKIAENLSLKKGEIFIITKYNKFYNSLGEVDIFVYLKGKEMRLSELLPQKNFEIFHNMAFYIWGREDKLPDIKNEFLKILKENKV